MISYYPTVVQRILEFNAIIDGEYPEFELLAEERDHVVDDAYISTMSEKRVQQWEQILGIKPMDTSTLDNRRDTIMARLRGQGKMNQSTIDTIVSTFTGGTANSWLADGVIHIEITPPPENKQYQFDDVVRELSRKIPAHLGIDVVRNYCEWTKVKSTYPTWQDVASSHATWSDVLASV
jgi:hypothetical protein